MIEAEILVTDFDKGQVVAGRIVLSGGKLKSHPNKGYENLLSNIMKEEIPDGKKKSSISPKEEPARWLRNLDKHYSGSLLRVALKKEDADDNKKTNRSEKAGSKTK